MDYGFKFENLVNQYLGTPHYVTYSTYWNEKNDRTSLLFTLCLKEYDLNSSGEIGQKLEYFMEKLFNDSPDKQISKDCVDFLYQLKSKQ